MDDNRSVKASMPNSLPSVMTEKKSNSKKKKNGSDTTANLARTILNNLNIFGKQNPYEPQALVHYLILLYRA